MTTMDSPNRTSRLVITLVTALALLWTGGVVLAPWLANKGWMLGGLLRLIYRPGCHQLAERCLDLGFGPMAVCARCFGLYVGGFLGLLVMTLLARPCRPRPVWLAAVAAPTILDFAAGQLGLPSLGNLQRMTLALPLGFFAAIYLGDALIAIVDQNTTKTSGDSVG